MNSLNQYKNNINSQNGEDGILSYIFSHIPNLDNICVEFGAWDGKHLSNTFNLIEKKANCTPYLIEGDVEKYQKLLITAKEYPSIIPILSYVGWEGANSLDNILLSNGLLKLDFDLLSIDVDGLDYKIWKHFIYYKPKVVIFEINSSLDPTILFPEEGLTEQALQKRPGVNFNTAITLAKAKGYDLLIHTGNCIFIRKDYTHYIPDYKEFYNDQKNHELSEQLNLFSTEWQN